MDKTGHKTLQIMNKATNYNRIMFLMIKNLLKGDVLEVGCGIGTFTKILLKSESGLKTLTAIDINKGYTNEVKNVIADKRLFVGYGDIEKNLYFKGMKKRFHTIISFNVLEHIKDDNKALCNMYSLLEKKGRVFLLTPSGKFAYGNLDKELGHYRRYQLKELEEKFKDCGFKVSKSYHFNLLGLLGWFVNGRILNRKVIPTSQLSIFDYVVNVWLKIESLIPNLPLGLSVVIIAEK